MSMRMGGMSKSASRARQETRAIKADREEKDRKIQLDKAKLGAQSSTDVQSLRNEGAETRLDKQIGADKETIQSQQQFKGLQKSLDRGFKSDESALKRESISEENQFDREQTTNENDLNRKNRLDVQRGDIAGRAFIGGMSGDQAQQIENSNSDNLEYAGLNMPKKAITNAPHRMVEETTEEGSAITGSFNQQTGKFTPRLGGQPQQQEVQQESNIQETSDTALRGMDPKNPKPAHIEYLSYLHKNKPEEFQRLMALSR